MRATSKLTLLVMTLVLAACNEKVSSELQSAGSTVGGLPPAVVPGEYYFNVVNTAPVLLNYKLHRTGAGNNEVACSIKKNVPLTNAIYVSGDLDSDITCFHEAEELSLHFNGLSFEIQASPNTCEYISYSPFSFYDYKPGDSTTTITKVTCMNDTTNNANVSATGLAPAYGAGLEAGCGEYVDTTILPSTDRGVFSVDEDKELCRFNYESQDGPNCDPGTVVVNDLQVTYTPANGGTPAVLKSEVKRNVIKCGGTPANCVGGPIKLEDSELARKSTYYSWIQPTVFNTAYTKRIEYKGTIERERSSTRELVNYRRDLASPYIDFIETEDLAYPSKFTGVKTFQPQLMDRYSVNKRMDAITPIIPQADYDDASYIMGGLLKLQRAKPYAADPYLAVNPIVSSIASHRVNPFYTFYCLDQAFDIKARVRMIVRDWDRVYPGDKSKLELISDLNEGASARQDAPNYTELPWDFDHYNMYNDLHDWDDFIYMTRTPGALDLLVPSSTVWEPKNGFFSPLIFPNEIQRTQ